MQNPVKERILKLREEIAQISEANRLYLQSGKNKLDAPGDNARRLQRLQEILDELVALSDWKTMNVPFQNPLRFYDACLRRRDRESS